MTGPAFEDPRTVLRRHGLQPKHSWGQCFLVDPRVHGRIVAAAELRPGERVIEIGAGLGTLTARLVEATGDVVAVERDRDLARVLRAELGAAPGLTLAEANALTFDYAAAAGERRAVVVGNLPYQIASPILFRLLESSQRRALRRIVVMLQREVAERMVAGPDGGDYGALSLLVQLRAEARIAFRVPPGAFHPPPRVWSAVVVLDPVEGTRAAVSDEERFVALVHAAFAKRRKTLWNALRGNAALAAPDDVVRAALEATGIDGRRRGETLSLDEFAALERRLGAGR